MQKQMQKHIPILEKLQKTVTTTFLRKNGNRIMSANLNIYCKLSNAKIPFAANPFEQTFENY
jgi:hypothetical protein